MAVDTADDTRIDEPGTAAAVVVGEGFRVIPFATADHAGAGLVASGRIPAGDVLAALDAAAAARPARA
ncbi:MAG TPA: hypothetical protein VD813_07060 [Pseudonocardia sp.]|nr:hypothetical protein [Pseudonocardia sp.]